MMISFPVVPWDCVGSWCSAIIVSFILGPLWILLGFFALWLAGFTVLGVAGGSCAAITQSTIGLVPAKSWFGVLQSLAALGPLALNPFVYLGSSLMTMALTITLFYYQACHFSTCPCNE